MFKREEEERGRGKKRVEKGREEEERWGNRKKKVLGISIQRGYHLLTAKSG